MIVETAANALFSSKVLESFWQVVGQVLPVAQDKTEKYSSSNVCSSLFGHSEILSE